MARGKKASTAKRGKRTVVKHATKAISKGRMKNARNECCPVIYKVCRPTFKTKKVDSENGWYKQKVDTGVKCKVEFGKRTFGKGRGGGTLSVEEADKKVSELTNVLEAKRCKAVVENERKKAVKTPSARTIAKQEKAMWDLFG